MAGPRFSEAVVSVLDWVVIGASGLLFLVSVVGAGFAFR